MSTWGGGYVTDIGYIPGYYRQQIPAHMQLCCLLNGVEAELPASGVFLDIGCGFGFVTTLFAAANPSWRVYGIDFNPAHIAEARAVAREAGATNVTFLEVDLARFIDEQPDLLPEIDFVTMHGVWSWVPPPVRTGIRRLLGAKLRAGGVVHMSYNSLPAWSGVLGFQRVLRESGLRSPGRSDKQAAAGLAIAKALQEAGARHLDTPFAKALGERVATMSPHYLAHEFMNGSWAPAFHAEVAAEMGQAKLEFVGSGNVLENFHDLVLNEQQRAVLAKAEDPILRELMFDCLQERGLRHDLYIRGARRLSVQQRDARLAELTIGLTVPAEKFAYEMVVPAGKASLEEKFYGPIVNALATGPKRVADLFALPEVVAQQKYNPTELVGILCGTDQAIVVPYPDSADHPAAFDFNRVAPARMLPLADNVQRMLAVALPSLGGGLPTNLMEMLVWVRLDQGLPPNVAALVPSVMSFAGLNLSGEVEKAVETILENKVPVWRSLGLLPAA